MKRAYHLSKAKRSQYEWFRETYAKLERAEATAWDKADKFYAEKVEEEGQKVWNWAKEQMSEVDARVSKTEQRTNEALALQVANQKTLEANRQAIEANRQTIEDYARQRAALQMASQREPQIDPRSFLGELVGQDETLKAIDAWVASQTGHLGDLGATKYKVAAHANLETGELVGAILTVAFLGEEF